MHRPNACLDQIRKEQMHISPNFNAGIYIFIFIPPPGRDMTKEENVFLMDGFHGKYVCIPPRALLT